jgi:DNA-binding transcriptional MerR regulator
MDISIPDKAYFRIGEVSRIVGVEPYVIRYWESEFKSVRPERTSADQRVYRKKDVQELLLIKQLLHTELYTINGARRQLRKIKEGALHPPGDAERDRMRLIAIKKGLFEIRKIVS